MAIVTIIIFTDVIRWIRNFLLIRRMTEYFDHFCYLTNIEIFLRGFIKISIHLNKILFIWLRIILSLSSNQTTVVSYIRLSIFLLTYMTYSTTHAKSIRRKRMARYIIFPFLARVYSVSIKEYLHPYNGIYICVFRIDIKTWQVHIYCSLR